jgi:hypothetical protein
MINFQDTPFSYACASCGKLTMAPFIDVCTERTVSNVKINLCSDCQIELARKILFRKSKEAAMEA